jgi:hypothetical protein
MDKDLWERLEQVWQIGRMIGTWIDGVFMVCVIGAGGCFLYYFYQADADLRAKQAAQEAVNNTIQTALWGNAANDPQAQAEIMKRSQDLQQRTQADLAEQNRRLQQQWAQIGQQMRQQQADAEIRRRQEMEELRRWQQDTNAYHSQDMPSPLPTYPQIQNPPPQMPGASDVYSQAAR